MGEMRSSVRKCAAAAALACAYACACAGSTLEDNDATAGFTGADADLPSTGAGDEALSGGQMSTTGEASTGHASGTGPLPVGSSSMTTGAPPPPTVLVLGDNNSEGQVMAALSSAGFEVTDGGFYALWDGADPDPATFDVVVYLDGYDFGDGLTAAADAALAQFVMDGGGLIRTEWSLWGSGRNPMTDALMPLTYDGTFEYGATWTVVDAEHRLTVNLPLSFTTVGGTSHGTPVGNTVVVVEDPTGHPMVSFRTDPGGTVVHINNDMTYSIASLTPEVSTMLVNAAAFAAGV